MGTTESIPLDEESTPSPANHPQAARPSPGSRPQQKQSPNPTKAKPVRKIDGLVLGGPQTGKRTLLQRLQGQDPFQKLPLEGSTPPSITIPYRTPKSRALPDRILLTVRQQQQQSTSDSPTKTEFVVLLVRPPWDECISVESLQLLERYLHQSGYRSNREERSEDIQPPVLSPVCICILFNFRDVSADSSAEDWDPVLTPFHDLLHQYKVPKEKAFIQPISTSLRDCYGLDMLHGFIYRTYLFHKQTTLEKQMHWVSSQLQQTATPDVVSYAEFQKNASIAVETPSSKPQRKVTQGPDQTSKQAERQDEAHPTTRNDRPEDEEQGGSHPTSKETRPSPGKPSRILPEPPSTAKPIRIGREALEAFLASDSDSDDEGESRPSTAAESSDDDDEDFFYDEKGRFRHETDAKAGRHVNRQGSRDTSRSSDSSQASSPPSTNGEGVSPRQESTESTQVTKQQDQPEPTEKPQRFSQTKEDTADKRKNDFSSRKRVSFADQQDTTPVKQEEDVATRAEKEETEVARTTPTDTSDEGSDPIPSDDSPRADTVHGAGGGDEDKGEGDPVLPPDSDAKPAIATEKHAKGEHTPSPQVQAPSKDDSAADAEDSDDDDEFVIQQQHDDKDEDDDDDEFVIQEEPSQQIQPSEDKDDEDEFIIQEQQEPPVTPEDDMPDDDEPAVPPLAETSLASPPTKDGEKKEDNAVSCDNGANEDDDEEAFVIRQDPGEDEKENERSPDQMAGKPSTVQHDTGVDADIDDVDDDDDGEFVIQDTNSPEDHSEHDGEDKEVVAPPPSATAPTPAATTPTPAAPPSSGLSSAAMAAILAAQQEAEAMLQQAQGGQVDGAGTGSTEDQERQRERERKERKKEKKEKKKKDGKKKKKKKDKREDDDDVSV